MIVRKPFAFLIKYFKIIHLFILALLSFVCYKYNGIVSFLNDYIKTGSGEYDVNSYINYTPIYVIILSIALLGIIFYLMRYKDKPTKLYLYSIVGYIVIIILFIVLFNFLSTFSNSVIDQKTLRLYRDISVMGLIFQYIIIVNMLIRGLGFDIKKFNFSKDIQELNIELSDNEEVELVMGLDTNKTKFRLRRLLREFGYFVKENVLIVGIVSIIVVVALWISVSKYLEKHKIYSEGDTFGVDFSMVIEGSYITKENSNMEKLSLGDNSLLIIKYKISSKYNDVLNPDSFILSINNKSYSPSNKYCNSEKDISTCYSKTKLSSNYKEYMFIYVIPSSLSKKKMYLKYDYGYITNESNSIIKVRLNPINVDSEVNNKDKNINDSLLFINSILSNNELKIIEFDTSDSYMIENDRVLTANNNKTIMKIKYSSGSDLVEDYATLKYVIDGEEYISSLKLLYSDSDYIYYEVSSGVNTASKVMFTFNIRHSNYNYVLIV